MRMFAAMARFLERDRPAALLTGVAALLGLGFVLATFDLPFLAGTGAFWANPRGAWLMDPADKIDSIDVLTSQVGWLAFLRAPWGLPLFYVPDLGEGGSSVILVDAVPAVALLSKLVARFGGVTILPYGAWVGACFVLAAVFATRLMAALGQRSLLAAIGASVLAMAMPELLFRFGHLSLMGQFMIVGALWLYARDARAGFAARVAWWAGWLALACLLHAYLFAMVAAIYAATWLARLDREHPPARLALGDPALVGGGVALVIALAGHFGKGSGASKSGEGFGYYSMNLLSPIWPQHSGLFPGFDALLTGTDGQYEGFNYLGAGVLALLLVAVLRFGAAIPAALRRHLPLLIVLVWLALFAVSNAVFAGRHLLFHAPLPPPLAHLAGVFRSSGRMFWPCAFALAMFGLAFVLQRLRPGWRSAVVLACCLLQLLDAEPLRARLGRLTTRATPTLIDLPAWQARMAGAERVHVAPPFACVTGMDAIGAGADGYIVHLELQRAAMLAGRPIDSANMPRDQVDCAAAAMAETSRATWDPRVLHVFLTGMPGLAAGWRPPGLACAAFDRGVWCLGAAP